jgi:hypothetical protein
VDDADLGVRLGREERVDVVLSRNPIVRDRGVADIATA